MPIDDGYEIDESSLHTNIGDIRTPYLICVSNFQIMEEIRIFLVYLVRYGCVFVRIDGSYTESFHKTPDFETSCIESFLSEYDTHSSRPKEWMYGIYLIESFEDSLFLRIFSWYIVVAGSGYSEKFCLTRNGQKSKVHIHKGEFSSMVTFLQAVYIFF